MRSRAWLATLPSVLLAAAVALPVPASAKRTRVDSVPTLPKTLRKSRSLGQPWKGRLERAVRLEAGEHIRYVTEYTKSDHFYGAWQLVQLLERAAQRVSVRMPGAKLSVGELSASSGGDLPGHASHENGRDVDVGFYMLDASGRPYHAFAFADFDAQGRGLAPNQGLRFDARRNWELVQRLVSDGDTRVQFVFVAPAIKRLLLEEGRRAGASELLLSRAARVMVRPSEKHPHANHFHVRVYCSPNERPRCIDGPPYWPWYPGVAPRLDEPI